MMRRTFLALTLAASLGLAAAGPGETEDTSLTVTDAFARETIGLGKTGAAFLTVSNAGSEDDTLLAGATPAAGKVELHTHEKDGEIMRMRKVEAFPVPAQSDLKLQPGGNHIMLFDLAAPLAKGESFPLTLSFEKAGDITIDVSVVAIGDTIGHKAGHETMDHGQLDHGEMDHGEMDHDNGGHGHSGH